MAADTVIQDSQLGIPGNISERQNRDLMDSRAKYMPNSNRLDSFMKLKNSGNFLTRMKYFCSSAFYNVSSEQNKREWIFIANHITKWPFVSKLFVQPINCTKPNGNASVQHEISAMMIQNIWECIVTYYQKYQNSN